MKIGIFDSGFGGLSVMRSVVEQLPVYDYVYLGDTARTPYGSRSQDVVYAFTRQAVEFLFEEGCGLVIVACNTASADALRKIQQEVVPHYPGKNVLGVIIPAAEAVAALTQNRSIGVLATEGSVMSGAFVREITARVDSAIVVQQACPMFVPLVESGETDGSILTHYAARYTQPLLAAQVDTIILGCTHYEFLADVIQEVVGEAVSLVREGPVVAQQLSAYLTKHASLAEGLSTGGTRVFFTTDLSERFVTQGSRFYGAPIDARVAVLA